MPRMIVDFRKTVILCVNLTQKYSVRLNDYRKISDREKYGGMHENSPHLTGHILPAILPLHGIFSSGKNSSSDFFRI